MFDEYIHEEVFPFVYASTQSPGIPISTMGASLGAYHAANTLFRYPHQVKRCYALSGIYDLRAFMGGMYDENFYFHNPVDYLANLTIRGRTSSWRRARSGSSPDPARGRRATSPTRCRKCSRAKGDPALRRRLGTARRPRLAVLEGGDAGVSAGVVGGRDRGSGIGDRGSEIRDPMTFLPSIS